MNYFHNDTFEWSDQFKDLEILPIRQVNSENGRYYSLDEESEENEKYFSVTTVLSDDPVKKKALSRWRSRVGEKEANKISAFSAGRGTSVHTLMEKYIKGEKILSETVFPHVKEMFFSGISGIEKNLSKVHFLEKRLYSRNLRMAGTVDGIVEWNGVPSILDFKTSKKIKKKDHILDYFLQCTAYSTMFKELTGGYNISQIVVFIMVEGEPEPQVFLESVSTFKPELLKRVFEFYERRKDTLSLPPIFGK